ncbi:MerR family transcriptional regulator [Bacillus sp. FJAT-52991]|uniref:MerR family transcriptional regulator n=1 Tax=Bacillus kandeliae TaxID=3129297 RepID=A0ABZ2N1X6_9BACI
MRIGTFAKKFDVTIDTIRYYIELGLVIPVKKDTQFEFDQTCIDDMTLIKELKQYQFTLQEIHKVLSFKRITLFTDQEDIDYYIQTLLEKKQQLLQEKKQIEQSARLIDEKIDQLCKISVTEKATGVPLSFVSLFHCPTCQEALRVKDAQIQGEYLFCGQMECHCGYKAKIEDGIVITPGRDQTPSNEYYIYDPKLFHEIMPEFITLLEKGSLWMYKRMAEEDLTNRVVIQTNVETFVFSPKFVATLQPNVFYIFTGNSLEMLRKLKGKIQHMNPQLPVLYMVNSDLRLPMKQHSIDCVIDSLSFNEHSLLNHSFALETLLPYLKQDSFIVGNTSYYGAQARSLTNLLHFFPNSHPKNLHKGFVEEKLNESGFKITEKEYLGFITNPGEYVEFHIKKEKMHFSAYVASFQSAS